MSDKPFDFQISFEQRIAELEAKVRSLEDMRSVEASNILNLAKDLGIQIPSHAITMDGMFQQFRTDLFALIENDRRQNNKYISIIERMRHELRILINSSSPFGAATEQYASPPPQPQYKDPTNRDDSFIWNSITNKVGFTSPTTIMGHAPVIKPPKDDAEVCDFTVKP